MQPVKQWPATEKPRERFKQSGISILSDAELVALILGSGMRGKDVVSFARDLIVQFGSLRQLLSSRREDLEPIKGMGPAKIAALLAVHELSKRSLRENLIGKHAVQDPQSVLEYLYATMRDKKREVFKVMFLDKGNRILDEQDLFEGTVDQTVVHPREVIKAALDRHASAILLVHNHPSGRIQPSMEDRALTGKLQGACAAVGIKVLDHLIIGDNHYFSFSEQHLLS